MNTRVSESVRRANSRAIARRDAWRRQYSVVCRAIRGLKQEHRVRPYDPVIAVKLRTMRDTACDMMFERNQYIRFELVTTAYPYASIETMAAE
jgi:hypothetical protein